MPQKENLSETIYYFVGGLRSCMGFIDSGTFNELRTETRIVKITFAGLRKSHFQDFFTEEALNYPINVKS